MGPVACQRGAMRGFLKGEIAAVLPLEIATEAETKPVRSIIGYGYSRYRVPKQTRSYLHMFWHFLAGIHKLKTPSGT